MHYFCGKQGISALFKIANALELSRKRTALTHILAALDFICSVSVHK